MSEVILTEHDDRSKTLDIKYKQIMCLTFEEDGTYFVMLNGAREQFEFNIEQLNRVENFLYQTRRKMEEAEKNRLAKTKVTEE